MAAGKDLRVKQQDGDAKPSGEQSTYGIYSDTRQICKYSAGEPKASLLLLVCLQPPLEGREW